MNNKEFERINKQIDALKKKTYDMLKALTHLSQEISTLQTLQSEEITEEVIDMYDGEKIKIFLKNGGIFKVALIN